MPLQDPVVLLMARTMADGEKLQKYLNEQGIESKLLEPHSFGEFEISGSTAHWQGPVLIVSRTDKPAALEVLENYPATESTASAEPEQPRGPISCTCEKCQATIVFDARLQGTVQECTRCGALMDVGPLEDTEAWWMEGAEPESDSDESESA